MDQALSLLGHLPDQAAGARPEDLDALILRGTALVGGRLPGEGLPGPVARRQLRAGWALVDSVVQCLYFLSGAEYSLGLWDDASVHGELAVAASRKRPMPGRPFRPTSTWRSSHSDVETSVRQPPTSRRPKALPP